MPTPLIKKEAKKEHISVKTIYENMAKSKKK